MAGFHSHADVGARLLLKSSDARYAPRQDASCEIPDTARQSIIID
jgi:hypothetical protein